MVVIQSFPDDVRYTCMLFFFLETIVRDSIKSRFIYYYIKFNKVLINLIIKYSPSLYLLGLKKVFTLIRSFILLYNLLIVLNYLLLTIYNKIYYREIKLSSIRLLNLALIIIVIVLVVYFLLVEFNKLFKEVLVILFRLYLKDLIIIGYYKYINISNFIRCLLYYLIIINKLKI
ncbi:hypothetical protein LX32DRAFT_657719 [Colletotrichum zoysiae]|uniref:Uncharacterized protein n=1 Tax=Colletotrichum zoysiae TaxID=1216348 RepID=A0AAD9H4X1_9PEZI|nr:hypothetical protein LX32DRAFT_657719 [Colletotrichum zoysiae]